MGKLNILRTLKADFKALFNHQQETYQGSSFTSSKGKAIIACAILFGPILIGLVTNTDILATYEIIILSVFYYVVLRAISLNWNN